jgi:hypothetical protein
MAIDNLGEAIALIKGTYTETLEGIAAQVEVEYFISGLMAFNASMGVSAETLNVMREALNLIIIENHRILDHLDLLLPAMLAYHNGEITDGD